MLEGNAATAGGILKFGIDVESFVVVVNGFEVQAHATEGNPALVPSPIEARLKIDRPVIAFDGRFTFAAMVQGFASAIPNQRRDRGRIRR